MTTATDTSARHLTPAELAHVVKHLRELRGWSQEQLAEIAKLSARTVQRVEEGASASSVDTRRALAAGFGFEDIDSFNKPYVIPTPEEVAAEKERFDKLHVMLKVTRIESGKQLGLLAVGRSASLFAEGVELDGETADLFAQLSDYAREYGDGAELYSAVDKLAVYEELASYVEGLRRLDVCLVAATRAVIFRSEPSHPGVRGDILYVMAYPDGKAPQEIAVLRKVSFA